MYKINHYIYNFFKPKIIYDLPALFLYGSNHHIMTTSSSKKFFNNVFKVLFIDYDFFKFFSQRKWLSILIISLNF